MTGTRKLATNPSDSQKEQDSAGGSRECTGIGSGGGRQPAGSWADSTTGTGQEDLSRPVGGPVTLGSCFGGDG